MSTQQLQAHLARDPSYLDCLIKENKAADFLSHSVRTIQKWRLTGDGPRYVRISSRSVRYRRRDLIAWSEEHLRAHSSAA